MQNNTIHKVHIHNRLAHGAGAAYTLQKVPTQKNKNKESGQFNVRTNNYACVQKLITLSITINNKSYNNYT